MKCSMVILNYCDYKRAIALAQKCAEYDIVENIVIVDNKSPDNSYDELKKVSIPKTEIIQSVRNGGFAAGNNFGGKYMVEKYNPEYLFYANTDTDFPEENLKACIKALEKNPQFGVVSTRMVGPDGKEQKASYDLSTYKGYIPGYFWVNRKKAWKQSQSQPPKPVEYKDKLVNVGMVRGSFMFFRTQALVEADYFDENTFLYCEEVIMAYRLKNAGYLEGLITDKFYVHNHIETPSNNQIAALKRLFKSRYYFISHYTDANVFQRLTMKVLGVYAIGEMSFINLIKKLTGSR